MKGNTKNTRPLPAGYDTIINVVQVLISIIRLIFLYQEYLQLVRYEGLHSPSVSWR